MYAISGSCGHRDANSAQNDILLDFAGLSPENIAGYYCYAHNTSSASRALRNSVMCTTTAPTVHYYGATPASAPQNADGMAGVPSNAHRTVIPGPDGSKAVVYTVPIRSAPK
jgi:hypothetical protein